MTFAGLWMLGDNHQVSVDLRALPAKVRCVCVAFTLSLTQREHLGMLQSVCCRLLLDPRAAPIERTGDDVIEPGTELCRFAMGCQPLYRKNGVVLARLERVVARQPDGTLAQIAWKFVAMGCPIQGTTPIVASQELSRLAAPALNKKPRRSPVRGGSATTAATAEEDETDKKEKEEKTVEEAEEGVAPSEELLPVDESGEIDYSKVPEVRLFEECDEEALRSTVLVPIDVTNGPSGAAAGPSGCGSGLSSSARVPAAQPSVAVSVSRSMRRLIGGQAQEPPRPTPLQRQPPQRQPPPPPSSRPSGKDSCCVM